MDWRGRWRNVDKVFFESVVELAGRLQRAKFAQSLDRGTVWRMAWISTQFDRSTLDDCIERLKQPGIEKPKAYLSAAMAKLCQRNGEDWDRLKLIVPEVPPPPKKTATTLDSELNLIAG